MENPPGPSLQQEVFANDAGHQETRSISGPTMSRSLAQDSVSPVTQYPSQLPTCPPPHHNFPPPYASGPYYYPPDVTRSSSRTGSHRSSPPMGGSQYQNYAYDAAYQHHAPGIPEEIYRRGSPSNTPAHRHHKYSHEAAVATGSGSTQLYAWPPQNGEINPKVPIVS